MTENNGILPASSHGASRRIFAAIDGAQRDCFTAQRIQPSNASSPIRRILLVAYVPRLPVYYLIYIPTSFTTIEEIVQ
jgi:hypothetical protein